MAQGLLAYTDLIESLVWFPVSIMWLTTACTSSSRNLMPVSGLHKHTYGAHTHMEALIYKIKPLNNLKN